LRDLLGGLGIKIIPLFKYAGNDRMVQFLSKRFFGNIYDWLIISKE